MGCIIEFTKPFVRFDFCENKYKQKMQIAAFIRYSLFDIDKLASHLNVPVKMLFDVLDGQIFLPKKPAELLAKSFMLLFGD